MRVQGGSGQEPAPTCHRRRRAYTRSCNQEQEGEADGAPASHQHRRSSVGIPQPEEGRYTGDRRADMAPHYAANLEDNLADLHERILKEERIERFPLAAVLHPEARWQATAAGDRGFGG